MRIKALFTAAAFLTNAVVADPVVAQNQSQNSSPATSQTRHTNVSQELSPQAAHVLNFMQQHGNTTIVMLDKNNAELLVMDEGRVVMRTPALYGKGIGEDERRDMNATPAGIFSLGEKLADPSQYEGGIVIKFLGSRNGDYVIHPTYQLLPSQRRNERLASPTPDDNAISNGCVNIAYPFFTQLNAYLKSKIRYIPNHEGTAVVAHMPPFVVLPENADPEATIRALTSRAPTPANAPVNNAIIAP